MGQQQLILIILVTVIVGIATVVSINTFGTAADQANLDAVNSDIATLASAAQGFYLRSEAQGGGGRQFDGLTFERLPFPSIGISADGDVAENENGRYIISDTNTGNAFTITAHPASCEGYTTGTTDGNGVLTPGNPCDLADQLTAGVSQNRFKLNASASDLQ